MLFAARRFLVSSLLLALAGPASAASVLAARGYSVIPEPRAVALGNRDVRISGSWKLAFAGTDNQDPAVETVRQALGTILVEGGSSQGVIRLAVKAGSVQIGDALDKDKAALQSQAYSLAIAPNLITISASAPAGLFYGAQTLAQLLKKKGAEYQLPEGRITDWPDLQLRQIYWDDAHHLDRIDYLKEAIRKAAYYKINGFALKLEGHFQYRSASPIVEPWALTPEQYQELTNYGLRYYVQLIPYLDAPAHVAFLLKHPEYEKLRISANNNYEFCIANPDTYKLLFSMFDDLLAANRGVKYFYLSTDEAYYVGKTDTPQCNEKEAADKLGGNGRLLAQFIQRAVDYLHDRGRTVIFWGEFPLRKEDIASLPKHLVNGEVNGPEIDRLYRDSGHRQTIYIAVEGEEKLFPEYFPMLPTDRLRPPRGNEDRATAGRAIDAYEKIARDSARQNADLMGAVVAAWGDMGLHTETFWLGYAVATSAAWNPKADPRALMASFYPLHYGPDVVRMDRAYQLLSQQARFWNESWETAPSNNRKPIVGNSYGIFPSPMPARDQLFSLPPVPSPTDLTAASDWIAENKRLLELVAQQRALNDEVVGLLEENVRRADRNRHSLEVLLTIANICRENLDAIDAVAEVARHFAAAQASHNRAPAAVAQLDRALDAIARWKDNRNRLLLETNEVWSKSWHLRVPEANNRRFLHGMDDVKDHLPDRSPDMSYLIYRELKLPVDDWFNQILTTRNGYATSHGLPARTIKLNWSSQS